VLTYYVSVAGLFGLLFGSAINAMVWRLHVGRSWVRGRSECPECGHTLSSMDLVPVLSWIALGGKCRYCRAPIKDHPIVEVLTGVVFALSAYVLIGVGVASWVQFGFWLILAVMLIILAVYDQRWLLLPDKVMLPLIVVAFAYCVSLAVAAHSPRILAEYLLTAMLTGGAFYSLVFFSKGRAMGGGDIKLAFAMGLILGPERTLLALLVAFNVAAIVGVALIAMRRRSRRDQIPFGPFLVAGTVIAFLFGQQIIEWYLRLNGLT
jgi:prepilin signal peptidase PulO-like enzyme (type II secretory pathway)